MEMLVNMTSKNDAKINIMRSMNVIEYITSHQMYAFCCGLAIVDITHDFCCCFISMKKMRKWILSTVL